MALQARHIFECRETLFCNWAVLLKHLILTDKFWSLSVSSKQCADASCLGSVVFASIGSHLCGDITEVVFLASLWNFIACQLKGEYLQGRLVCGWEWKQDSCVQGCSTREPCSACITFCGLQAQGAWAKLILAMPSWGIHLQDTQHSNSLLVLLVWFLQRSLWVATHVSQALLVHKEPDSSSPGGPVTFTLSGPNCSPASNRARQECLPVKVVYLPQWL